MTAEVAEVEIVRMEANRIEDAVTEIEFTIAKAGPDLPAEDWRKILGIVEQASRRTYRLRKMLLDEAVARRGGEV